jgi:hypothetical protein
LNGNQKSWMKPLQMTMKHKDFAVPKYWDTKHILNFKVAESSVLYIQIPNARIVEASSLQLQSIQYEKHHKIWIFSLKCQGAQSLPEREWSTHLVQVRRPPSQNTRDSSIAPPSIKVGTSCHRHPAPLQNYNLWHISHGNNSNLKFHTSQITMPLLNSFQEKIHLPCVVLMAPMTVFMKREQAMSINNHTLIEEENNVDLITERNSTETSR